MDTPAASSSRLFPRGTAPLAIAVGLAALGNFLVFAELFAFLAEVLGDHDRVGAASAAFAAATALFYAAGGVWGDFGGHRRNLILGPALAAGGAILFAVLPTGGGGDALPLVVLAVAAFACGRSLFTVAAHALAAHAYEDDSGRVPLAGAYTLLHLVANVGVLLLAPLAAGPIDSFFADAFGLGRDEGRRLVFVVAMQPLICATIVAAIGRRAFAGIEAAAKGRIGGADTAPFDDGARRYRPAALAFVLGACLLGFAAYDGAMSGAFAAAALAPSLDGDLVAGLQLANGLIVVFLAPVAMIVYGRMWRGDGRVPTAPVAAIGAGLIAIGLAALAAAPGGAPGSADPFAPPWLEESPSAAWPIAAMALVSLGEILFVPAALALVAALAPRRLRGLLLGCALAATPVAALAFRAARAAFDELPRAAELTACLVAAVAAAALLAVAGTVFRRKEPQA